MGIITKAAKAFNEINWDKVGIFTGGVLFGTAGIKILSSKDARRFIHRPLLPLCVHRAV